MLLKISVLTLKSLYAFLKFPPGVLSLLAQLLRDGGYSLMEGLSCFSLQDEWGINKLFMKNTRLKLPRINN